MTKEEIEELIGLAAGMGLYDDKNPGKRAVILGKAIKELQQEPCKNAISRQEMLKYFEEAIQWVKDMPPVNPQEPKTGQWIERVERDDWDDSEEVWYECDQCHTDWGGAVNFCPNCGAKMEEGSGEE